MSEQEVWVVINKKTHKLIFYGTQSEAASYEREMSRLWSDPLKVRLLRVGMIIYEAGEEQTK